MYSVRVWPGSGFAISTNNAVSRKSLGFLTAALFFWLLIFLVLSMTLDMWLLFLLVFPRD